ncbi:PTS sugar transporter subunit IIB [Enterococcus hulanensis]|uniref:PTS sugar transporter subunit IIB n=1 Tax=Enterococcus hulanensis TaxID=2559929 RepID=UPI001A8F36FD|nr:PTS sugar transporter subunit IIB [Enterococcus hulanensis]MBO0459750.1 PTS sugar transporter subunit IIB [Enterococcus hulanensis]
MIVNVRIDERLIHGQVATMWTNHLKANRIMVVDNEVVKNEMEKDVLKMAKPNSVKLSILTTKGASARIKDGQYDNQKVFLIVKNPETLVELVDSGVELVEVNVGNMSAKKGSKQVAKSIGVTPENIESFNYLNEKGVKLVAQMVPNEDKSSFMKLLKEGD